MSATQNRSPKLKNIIIRYLVILIVFELLADLTCFLAPEQSHKLFNAFSLTWINAHIFLLRSLYRANTRFGYVVLVLFMFPVLSEV